MRVLVSLTCAVCTVLTLAAAPAARAASSRTGAMERAVIRSINHRRAHHGLRRLHLGHRLARAADFHTREMLSGNYFAHSSLHGASFATRIHRFAHIRAVGETIAWKSHCGRHAGRQIVSMWMHSPTHRAILLSHRFHRVGIGRRTGSLGRGRVCVVTGDFAR